MSVRLSPLLRSVVPFWGDMHARVNALRTLRLALVVVGVLNPVYWAVYHATVPNAFDPLWIRGVLCAGTAVLLVLTYVAGPIQRNPRQTLAILIHVLVVWYGYLAGANNLEADFAIGYYFMVLAGAMVYSLAWATMRPMAMMLGASMVVALGVVVAVGSESTGVSAGAFMLVLTSGGVIAFLTFAARLRAIRELERSEARLADAERLAETASWTYDYRGMTPTWSEGVYRLLGVDPSRPPLESADEFVHPDDLLRTNEEVGALFASGDELDHRFRIVRPSGEVRHLRSIMRLERDWRGQPLRAKGAYLDITDQVMHEATLEAARDQAEAAAEAKTAFLANMSHEIRTPLTAIIGFAQMLSEETGEEYADLVEPIEAGGTRLLGTLNSVLDLARMEAGEMDLNLVPTDLGHEARGVAALLRSQAEAKGLTLVVDGPAHGMTVLADPDALARVLTNLVSNSVKFTQQGGITLALRSAGDRVEVAVNDTGRGMDAAFMTELFEPFRQASTGWARSHEGTGLGLTITRQLIRAMDGTIDVESEVGVGTRFLVSLPAHAPEALRARPSAVSGLVSVAG